MPKKFAYEIGRFSQGDFSALRELMTGTRNHGVHTSTLPPEAATLILARNLAVHVAEKKLEERQADPALASTPLPPDFKSPRAMFAELLGPKREDGTMALLTICENYGGLNKPIRGIAGLYLQDWPQNNTPRLHFWLSGNWQQQAPEGELRTKLSREMVVQPIQLALKEIAGRTSSPEVAAVLPATPAYDEREQFLYRAGFQYRSNTMLETADGRIATHNRYIWRPGNAQMT